MATPSSPIRVSRVHQGLSNSPRSCVYMDKSPSKNPALLEPQMPSYSAPEFLEQPVNVRPDMRLPPPPPAAETRALTDTSASPAAREAARRLAVSKERVTLSANAIPQG